MSSSSFLLLLPPPRSSYSSSTRIVGLVTNFLHSILWLLISSAPFRSLPHHFQNVIDIPARKSSRLTITLDHLKHQRLHQTIVTHHADVSKHLEIPVSDYDNLLDNSYCSYIFVCPEILISYTFVAVHLTRQ